MWTDFTDSKNGDSFALVFDRVTAARIIRDDDLGPKQKKNRGTNFAAREDERA